MKCGVRYIIAIIRVTRAQKDFWILILIEQLLTKFLNFHEIAPNVTYSQKS